MLPKFHLFLYFPFILHTNLPIKQLASFNCFSLLFVSQMRLHRKKVSQIFFHIFLVVSSIPCILKKSSVFLCYLNPIFCHSSVLYATSCFSCKDPLLLIYFFFFSLLRWDCTGKRQVKKFFLPLLSRCFICNLCLCLQLSMIIFLNSHIRTITCFHLTLLVFQVMSATFTCCSSSPIPTSFVCLGKGINVDTSILSDRLYY